MEFTVIEMLGILIMYQALLFSLLLLFNKKAKPIFIKVLLIICVCIFLHFGFMVVGAQLSGRPLLVGSFFGLLYGPLYYHFAQSLMVKHISLQRQWFLYIPAVTVLVVLLLFEDLVRAQIDYFSVCITLHFASYLIVVLLALFRYRTQLKTTRSRYYEINLKWLEMIVYLQLAAIIVALAEGFIRSVVQAQVLVFVVYLLVLLLLHGFYYLGLKHIGLFMGFGTKGVSLKARGEYSLEPDVYTQYVAQLKTYIATEKPYLDFDITLADFADALAISTRNISHVINKEYNMHFYDFVNSFRLERAKELLLQTDKQVKEVMYESGFSNKATFNTFFKKSTGETPTQFKRQSKK